MNFEEVYREYFLFCMADSLEVGPKMLRLFGYDIVVSRDFAYFSMEKCNTVQGDEKAI